MNETDESANAAMRRWLAGTLSDSEARALEAWLESHPEAAAQMEEMAGVAEFAASHTAADVRDTTPALPGGVLERLQAADFSLPGDEAAAFALLDAVPQDGAPGRLGAFEIHGLLAAGGMGVVFDALDPALQRRVAIKVPHPAAGPAARERFMAEAQAVAALDHPDIVPVLSVHEHGGTVFFVMPMVEGCTLAQSVAERGPLSAAETVRIARHAARALAAAHAKGIVHRDIKPANILLEQDRARLTDFGIAQPAGHTGALSGSPDYMAPEQRSGEPVTPLSDLYSLGATLYFCLTGAPFSGQARRPRGWLGMLISRLLSPSPAQRPASAAEVLYVIRQHEPAVVLRRWCFRAAAVAAVLATLGAGATRWSVTAELLNRALISTERAFVVEGVFGAHTSMADAIRAAGADAVIRIHAEGPWTLRDVSVPEGQTLTIRAAEGVRPRFIIEDTAAPGIVSRGQLTLERLTFTRSTSADEAHGMIEAAAGTLTLRRCELRATGPARRDAGFPSALLVRESAAVQVHRCAIICTWAAAVTVHTTTPGARPALHLRDSGLIGMPVLWLRCAEGTALELNAAACSLPSPILLADSPATPLPEVNASFTRCLLRAETALWWAPGETPATLSRRLRWRGDRNLYAVGSCMLSTAPRTAIREQPPLALDLKQWEKLPGIQESDARAADLPTARNLEPGNRQRAVSGLTQEELEALAAPWRAQFPDTGADFTALWP